ncbi:Putative disease resistance protein RGA1 [Triticum urartu]|uniref:Putative disease resistance protein RGA1 n=1 Tax=Triticum urartu TaxID=4572 RepID=M8AW05_TRIUA|nr:Putative disease resistance protein RGA1 [Triticum urartu]
MAGVLDALASYVTNMLTQMAKEEVAMLIGVSDGIKDLSIKLGDLKNFLADADRRNITDESVQGWVGELKRAMYLAIDIVDLCQLKAMEQRPSEDMGCLNPLLFCMRNPLHSHDIGTRIKTLNKELDSICERGNKFKFAKLEVYQDMKMTRSLATNRKTDSLLERSGIVGEKIEEDTRALVEVLTSEEGSNKTGRYMVVAIVGVIGIGKTTLGKKVFNDEAIKGKFCWSRLSQLTSSLLVVSHNTRKNTRTQKVWCRCLTQPAFSSVYFLSKIHEALMEKEVSVQPH